MGFLFWEFKEIPTQIYELFGQRGIQGACHLLDKATPHQAPSTGVRMLLWVTKSLLCGTSLPGSSHTSSIKSLRIFIFSTLLHFYSIPHPLLLREYLLAIEGSHVGCIVNNFIKE